MVKEKLMTKYIALLRGINVGGNNKVEMPKLKKVFLVMGEPKASFFLAQRLRDYIGVNAMVPEYGQTQILD